MGKPAARAHADRVVYRLPKPQRDGTTSLTLPPLELIDHLAALIPPPRRHRHRYHGVLAPNAPLRAAAIAFGREVVDATGAPAAVSSPPPASKTRSPARYLWVMLLTRLFESLPLVCPNCGADMRIIAFITETAPVEQILNHIGEQPRPPPITPARGPPAWDDARRAGLGLPSTARAGLRIRSARCLVAAVSPAGNGAAHLVSRRRAALKMRAPAPRHARARAAPNARQPRCSVLTTHPTLRYRPLPSPLRRSGRLGLPIRKVPRTDYALHRTFRPYHSDPSGSCIHREMSRLL